MWCLTANRGTNKVSNNLYNQDLRIENSHCFKVYLQHHQTHLVI